MLDLVKATGKSSCTYCKVKIPKDEEVIRATNRGPGDQTWIRYSHIACFIENNQGICAAIWKGIEARRLPIR